MVANYLRSLSAMVRLGTVCAYGVPLLASAAALAFCLSSKSFPWLGWLSLLPLFASIRTLRPFHALVCGAYWGSSLYAMSTLVFETEVGAGFTSFMLLTAAPAGYAMLGACLTRWIGFSPFILGVSWMAVELVLQPIGLSTGLLAGVEAEGWLIRAIGPALGYVMCALIIAYVCAALLRVVDSACACAGWRRTMTGSAQPGMRLWPQIVGCLPHVSISPFSSRGPPVRHALA